MKRNKSMGRGFSPIAADSESAMDSKKVVHSGESRNDGKPQIHSFYKTIN
jgi:hypothetical protein